VTCRVLGISRSGFYEAASRPPSARALSDAALTVTIEAVHANSRRSYGPPRVHAELRLGQGLRVARKHVARLLRTAWLAGICHRRKRGRHRPLPAPHEDLVQRRFVADAPDRLWATDVTEHPTGTGKVYCCAVIEEYLAAHDDDPKPFSWTATADDILAKVARVRVALQAVNQ